MAGFFDKVVMGINKGVNTVSEGSKLIAEKAKLNLQLQDAEKEKAKLFQNIGMLVYNLQKNEEIHIEQAEAMLGEVDAVIEKADGIRAKLKALDAEKEQANTATAVPLQDGVVCSCGYTNGSDAKFCAKCGNKLGADE